MAPHATITLLHTDDCPHADLARERLAAALGRVGVTTSATERVVGDAGEAAALGFRGSPTILIDGRDPFPATHATGDWLACRLYQTATGTQGAPAVDELVEALGTST